jgi:uncharacterized Zn finger protein (UPF0148 family)
VNCNVQGQKLSLQSRSKYNLAQVNAPGWKRKSTKALRDYLKDEALFSLLNISKRKATTSHSSQGHYHWPITRGTITDNLSCCRCSSSIDIVVDHVVLSPCHCCVCPECLLEVLAEKGTGKVDCPSCGTPVSSHHFYKAESTAPQMTKAELLKKHLFTALSLLNQDLISSCSVENVDCEIRSRRVRRRRSELSMLQRLRWLSSVLRRQALAAEGSEACSSVAASDECRRNPVCGCCENISYEKFFEKDALNGIVPVSSLSHLNWKWVSRKVIDELVRSGQWEK